MYELVCVVGGHMASNVVWRFYCIIHKPVLSGRMVMWSFWQSQRRGCIICSYDYMPWCIAGFAI